jgi:hypothetical protein
MTLIPFKGPINLLSDVFFMVILLDVRGLLMDE